MDDRIVIGPIVRVDFPDFELKGVEAKIDTGAYRGTLHCESITLEKTSGGQRLCFVPLDTRFKSYNGMQCCVTKFKKVRVRSSNGTRQSRYMISTRVLVAGESCQIELTLSVRDRMRKPMLIGRKFLRAQNFLVDVNHKGRTTA